MKKMIAAALSLVMILTLAACGGSAKKQEAIDAFNAVVEPYEHLTELINANLDLVTEEEIDDLNAMVDRIMVAKASLESDEVLEDEVYDEWIAEFKELLTWTEETTVLMEELIAEKNG